MGSHRRVIRITDDQPTKGNILHLHISKDHKDWRSYREVLHREIQRDLKASDYRLGMTGGCQRISLKFENSSNMKLALSIFLAK
jgi:hypothetical protein